MKNNRFNLRALLISCFLVVGLSAFAQVPVQGTVIDEQMLSAVFLPVAGDMQYPSTVSLDYAIKNTDRAVGAMLSGAIAKQYGQAGLPEDTVNVKFKGSAGQSFGAFLVHGVNFKLEGETNDYISNLQRHP